MTTKPPLVLDMTEACRQLGVTKTTFRKYLAKGAFPGAFQLDANWRIPAADIDAFKAKRSALPIIKQPARKRLGRTVAASPD